LVREVAVTTIPLSEAKARLTRLVGEVQELGEAITITRSGRPAAVLLSVEEYEGLMETLEILADTDLTESIRRGLDELGRSETVTHDELWRDLDG
jgi:prevent-host-death family protein